MDVVLVVCYLQPHCASCVLYADGGFVQARACHRQVLVHDHALGRKPHLERVGTAATQPGHVGILDYKDFTVAVVVTGSTRAQGEVIPEYREQIIGVHGTRDIGVSPHTEAASEGQIPVGTYCDLRFVLTVERELERQVDYDAIVVCQCNLGSYGPYVFPFRRLHAGLIGVEPEVAILVRPALAQPGLA